MNAAWAGWALALAAVAAGWWGYGWPGLVLALTVIVFWLLLQFSRALRALHRASGRPVGTVPNAVMLHARLRAGMRLPQVLALTGSLGRKTADQPETFAWHDEAGDQVAVELQDGRVTAWRLQRQAAGATATHADTATDAAVKRLVPADAGAAAPAAADATHRAWQPPKMGPPS